MARWQWGWLLVVVAALTGCSSDSSESSQRNFERMHAVTLPVPAATDRAAVAAITTWDGTWYAAGSFRDAEGQHHPGLWTSIDAETWTRTETTPVTFYGEISELYSVAASARGLVAIGTATGGAHGNPRTVSWVLNADGTMHEVVNSFELYNGPRQISVRSVVDGTTGFVIIGSRVNQNNQLGATSWTSPTGEEFTIHDDDPVLSSSTTEQKFGFDVARAGDPTGGQLVAVGEHTTFGPDDGETDGAAWTSPDGVTWTPWTPEGLDLGGPEAQRPQRISIEGDRMIIAGSETGTPTDSTATSIVTWTTADGSSWTRTTVAPFGSNDNVLSAATGVAIVGDEYAIAARTGDTLHVAMSNDGKTWTELHVADDLPTGNRANITVAGDGDTLLVGATSLDGGGLWISTKP